MRRREFSPISAPPHRTFPYAVLHESAFGTKRTFRHARSMSAFGGKADIKFLGPNVR
jgi:hypothetical protein